MTANINLHADGSYKTKEQVGEPQIKPWVRLSSLLNTIVSICVAWWPARKSLVRHRSVLRNSVKHRMLSLSQILFTGIAALWMTTTMAQSNTFYVGPVLVYSGGPYVPFWSPSLAAGFANAQAQVVGLDDSNWNYTALNLHPDDLASDAPFYYYNGTPTRYRYDVYQCYLPEGPSCGTDPEWGLIDAEYVCPAGSDGGTDYNSPDTNQLIACAVTISPVQPPPKYCLSCLGNPIFASTGQKMQVETDYSGLSGLAFTRTYWSSNGFFASVLTQAFANNSSPAGTTSPACYPAYYDSYSYGSGFYCFPYISTYGYVNGGAPQYQLQTEDGRTIQFTGPNSAVTAAADVNERVTLITVGGAVEWQVKRDDDSTEIYSAAGSLIQKTLRGGRTFTYTYSTASTPANIAPSPGLLLTQSDAFGHTLSWQYNAGAQMSQMTDPAGGIYQYSYDTNGNLTEVLYPDSSSKTYWYNESANTGGTSMPSALTGITDESAARFATFQYQSSSWFTNNGNLAVNTQHAGGVDSYTFSYSAGGSPTTMTSTTVTDPLGTVRTYNFQNGLSYNDDSSQTQPAASGSGTVTQSET